MPLAFVLKASVWPTEKPGHVSPPVWLVRPETLSCDGPIPIPPEHSRSHAPVVLPDPEIEVIVPGEHAPLF